MSSIGLNKILNYEDLSFEDRNQLSTFRLYVETYTERNDLAAREELQKLILAFKTKQIYKTFEPISKIVEAIDRYLATTDQPSYIQEISAKVVLIQFNKMHSIE